MTFLETVLGIIDKKNITKNKMLTDLKLSKNSFVAWSNRGTIPNGETLIKIADYLNCSVDYLLGRSNDYNKEVLSNEFTGSTITNSVVGNSSANVIVGNNNTYKPDNELKKSDDKKQELSKQAAEIIRIYENLDARKQMKLFSMALELESQK